MANIRLVNTRVTIDGKTVEKYVAEQRASINASKKGDAKARTVVLKYFSDFISQQGLLKAATASGNFEKATARPDIQGSLEAFRQTFGVDVTPTQVPGRTAEAFAELKQRTSADRAVTLTSIQLGGSNLQAFTSKFGLTESTNESGEATFIGQRVDTIPKAQLIELITSDKQLEAAIVLTIKQKFENFIVIDYLDKAHNNKPTVKILANANELLNLTSITSDSIDITARVVKSSNKSKAYIKLEFKLSDKAYALFVKKATDATIAFHNSLSKNVSTNFIKYAIKQFSSGSAKTDVNIFLKELLSIAIEFEKGSDTPIEYESNIPKQIQGTSSLGINYSGLKTAKKESKQSFISGVQWTVLTQKRLGETMLNLGEPEPPDLKERSGRFRSSVQVFANYRTSTLQYIYNPLYSSLHKYGYRPDLQVETAIREVAQSLYAQKFNIVRGNKV
jgi:hypothetical protein